MILFSKTLSSLQLLYQLLHVLCQKLMCILSKLTASLTPFFFFLKNLSTSTKWIKLPS